MHGLYIMCCSLLSGNFRPSQSPSRHTVWKGWCFFTGLSKVHYQLLCLAEVVPQFSVLHLLKHPTPAEPSQYYLGWQNSELYWNLKCTEWREKLRVLCGAAVMLTTHSETQLSSGTNCLLVRKSVNQANEDAFLCVFVGFSWCSAG